MTRMGSGWSSGGLHSPVLNDKIQASQTLRGLCGLQTSSLRISGQGPRHLYFLNVPGGSDLEESGDQSQLTDLGRPRRNGKPPGGKNVPWETIAWENACLGNCLLTLPRTNRCPPKIGVWGQQIQHNRMQL